MYVRGAKKREEVWLLDRLDELDIPDPAFRSRDYVIALDEESGQKAGFGRIRIHKGETTEYVELAAVATLPEWRRQGVGAHVVERLIERAGDKEFETVFAFTDRGGYLTQFGFEAIDPGTLPAQMVPRYEEVREREPEAVALRIAPADFGMPPRLRNRFKEADAEDGGDEPLERPEDFGIDPESATYKYDTGR